MVNDFPQALTIAGTDSGGGAGVMADIKTMQENHVFAAAVVVAVTAQNTLGVTDFMAMPTKLIDEQFKAVAEDLQIRAVKTGMLADSQSVKTVVANLQKYDLGPLTVDPVMIAKGGARLLAEDAIATVRDELLPLATILTPNLPEAEVLAEMHIRDEATMQLAGHRLQELGAKNVIVKGGHETSDTASDFVLLENGESFWVSAPRVETKRTHGTGDTLSSAITAELAKGADIKTAIQRAKRYVSATIANGIEVGHGHGPLNHWAGRQLKEEKD
ncbi:bifunctional hydroxymethylpyrimidine kinase/phosphomethylpyrimidine kinase [Lentilactobacillus senioris]|uniref:bifunctional hydroxymethylpyrimidine kinase/phosphomethylpyrimidine kinase n=1 Tax=Lentilactobacillus senioris TaxID=931534 RepID=UPI0022816B5B|nr:bifunctional hydroxymethylpyrimidine kinase/phosphomethylpyrimidine kinase [Lentilactobacillus senioris]MCY9806333.1 bifunctional hydroxymethylpyrimidine kinase/phosphomethylpyrimidine kinase [Lentilactobacillus senioris]